MNYQILGTLYTRPELDADGELLSEPVQLEGFHVNSDEPFVGLDQYKVTPVTPQFVIAGIETFFYTFPDEAFWLSLGSTDEEGNWVLNEEFVPVKKPEVPTSVTKRQGRQQLILMGLLETVETMIELIPDPTEKQLAESFWNDSSIYERNHPQMISLSQALNISSSELDDIFIAASQL
jgi:hypothetical protein